MTAAELNPRAPSVATSELALEAREITVHFGGVTALAGVHLSVPHRTIVGLVGPNGAGKTTMFGVLSGLLRPNTGVVLMAGRDVTSTTPQTRARMGLARTFQHPELFLGLTVREHLVLAHRVRHAPRRLWSDLVTGRALRAPDRHETERVGYLIAMLDLAAIADHSVSGLPLGMNRRVEMGRALASGPSLLLLDEPFSGLDANESEHMVAGLLQIVADEGVAMLLVEHDVDIVLGVSAKVFVLDFGLLIAEGNPAEIRASEAVRAAYLGAPVATADGGG